MVIAQEPNEQEPRDIPGISFDRIDNLYVGHFENAEASIQTDIGSYPASLWGEILFYGQFDREKEVFTIESLRRLAVGGGLKEPDVDQRIGVLSLAGPLESPAISPDSPGEINAIGLQLHYAALTEELKPRVESDHVVIPEVETIFANLKWDQISPLEGNKIVLNINLIANELVDAKLGIIKTIELNDLQISFELAGTGGPLPEPHRTIQSGCSTPTSACSPGKATMTRTLRVKFINFTTEPNIENIINSQINGVCQVWRNKAALTLVVDTTLVNATAAEKTQFNTVSSAEETSIHSLYNDLTQPILEVYIITAFSTAHGGGFTLRNATTADPWCIMEVGAANTNPNLLAHEVGHALGLAHPDGTQGVLVSSPTSVMQTAALGTANPQTNTLFNCRVFKCCTPTLTPVVQTTSTADCFRPDADYFIRDFPAYTGAEPAVVPPGQRYWDNSNVWNRDTNDPGPTNTSGGPTHHEPLCSDNSDFMFVRLDYTTTLRDPVDVDLYLAVPGASPMTMTLAPLAAAPNNQIHFTNPTSSPVTRSLNWNPQAMAAMYPSHCCVFALAHPPDDCTVCLPQPPTTTPITFSGVNFAAVAANVLNSSKIAQRNLNFQDCASSTSHMVRSVLPWLQMANPFRGTASARIEVDATQAVELDSLTLEVDDQIVSDIKLGEQNDIPLTAALRPADQMIVRFHASIPPKTALGKSFPIPVRFVVNNQFVSGYTHVVRVVPLTSATIQVLDKVSAALEAIRVGCKLAQAEPLVQMTRRIVLRERSRRSPGCFGMLWRLIRPRDAWRFEMTALSGEIELLAQALGNKSEPECQMAHNHLAALAKLLATSKDIPAPVLLEQVRAEADKTYQPASSLARRQWQA